MLCAASLTAALFAGCAKNDIKTDGTATDADSSATATDAAEEKTARQPSSASVGKGRFPTGGWEDADVRFEFLADGKGYMMYKSDYDGDSLTYEVVADSNSVTVRFGAADASEEVIYETPDENTLILKFADGQTYTLFSADEFVFPTSGIWENETESYEFRDDYSGTITNKADGSGVDFEYDVFSSDYVFYLLSSPDNAEIV